MRLITYIVIQYNLGPVKKYVSKYKTRQDLFLYLLRLYVVLSRDHRIVKIFATRMPTL